MDRKGSDQERRSQSRLLIAALKSVMLYYCSCKVTDALTIIIRFTTKPYVTVTFVLYFIKVKF